MAELVLIKAIVGSRAATVLCPNCGRISRQILSKSYDESTKAELLLDAQVSKIIKNLATEKGIELVISDNAMNKLIGKALDNLGNGGRGIGNIVESLLINPLARYLFDEGISENVKITLNDIDAENMPFALDCTYEAL